MFYHTRHILRTLLLLITGCSEGCIKSPVHFFRKNWLQNWITKNESFFRDGIRKLPERWEQVVGSDGQYFNLSVLSFCFEINAQKKRTELICTPNNFVSNNNFAINFNLI